MPEFVSRPAVKKYPGSSGLHIGDSLGERSARTPRTQRAKPLTSAGLKATAAPAPVVEVLDPSRSDPAGAAVAPEEP